MREIKFRVWVESILARETGLYHPDVMQLLADGSVDKLWTDDYKFTSDTCKFTLMQYTGLKDANGVEIYEGDILKRITPTSHGSKHYKVIWQNSLSIAGFNIKGTGRSLEVIGNIYENKEQT